jgi:beta-lactam-binding protein with PASTA domain
LSSNTPTPADQVEVPNFVGMTYDAAQTAAADADLELEIQTSRPSDQPDNTVIEQNPGEGTLVDRGSTVKVVLDLGEETVAVPDLRGKTESEALNAILQAKLTVGTRTEEFDAFIPLGSVVGQTPGAGQIVTQGLAVNYVVSKGPEPTPTPSPTPSPTPEPTPPPTAPPTPTAAPPTPSPTPAPLNVGDYRCLSLADATTAILGDGFTVGTTGGDTSGLVVAQSPGPGAKATLGSPIDLTFENPPVSITCP